MKKQNVFVVTGRHTKDGIPAGKIVTVVVCSTGEKEVRGFLGEKLPAFLPTTVTGLTALEERVRMIKGALAGELKEWPVIIDPSLSQ